MKGIMLIPLVSSLTACGYIGAGVSDYTTVYPTTAGCCNSVVVEKPCCKQVVVKPAVVKPVVVKPVVKTISRPCCANTTVTSRPIIASPCCSSVVQATPVYDTLTVVNTEPVDITTVSYDYY